MDEDRDARWEVAACPECGAAAEVTTEGRVGSTAGPVELVRVRCVHRHWFLMPADALPAPEAVPDRVEPRTR